VQADLGVTGEQAKCRKKLSGKQQIEKRASDFTPLQGSASKMQLTFSTNMPKAENSGSQLGDSKQQVMMRDPSSPR
jgi:hypothetical protein